MSDTIEAIIFSRPGETSLSSYMGALWAAESGGYLDDVKVWISPSVTCLFSVLKTCGCSCVEIMLFVGSLPQLSQPFIPFRNPLVVGQSLEPLRSALTKLITEKWGSVPTLEEAYLRTEVTLVGIGLCLDRQELEYIHRETYPHLSLVDLVCLSLATPGVYQPYKIDNEPWIDGSIIEAFSPKSVVLESGRVLAITSKPSRISFSNRDPISQNRDLSRVVFESLRQTLVSAEMNLVEIDSSSRTHSAQLREGWEAFSNLFGSSSEISTEGAELQS